MSRLFPVLILAATAAFAADADRTKPPETPPIPGFKLPAVYETKLPNGLGIVLVEDSRFPLVTARLAFHAGTKYDPTGMSGLSETVGALLTEGTKTRSARQIAEELAAIGGSLNAGAGADGLTLAGSALAEHTAQLLELMADAALNASFPADEIDLRKQNRKQSLMASRATPAFLATEKMASIIYGSHPYSRIAPTVESLDKIDAKALAGFRDTYLAPNNATLILLGKLPARAQTMKAIESRFGAWQKKDVALLAKAELPAPKRDIVLVDRSGSVQADIHVGQLGLTRDHPEYFPMLVGGVILGGGPASRMFNNIREKQGYAYDAHSELDYKKETGGFKAVTQVRNEVLEPALKSVLGELEGMAKERVSATELSDAKNYVAGMFLLRLETQSGLADQLTMMKLMGLPNQYLETYTARIRSVEPDQIQAAAKKFVHPENAAVVVVGDASKIAESLKKFGNVTITKAN